MGNAAEDNFVGSGPIRSKPQSEVTTANDEALFPDAAVGYLSKARSDYELRPLFGETVDRLTNNPDHVVFLETRGRGEWIPLCRTPWTYLLDPYLYTLHRLWFALVHVYTARTLTRAEDKLIAMSGFAERIKDKSLLIYLSGLWQASLPLDLLWFIHKPQRKRPASYHGPTWSWASLDHRVGSWLVAGFDRLRFEPLITFLTADITSNNNDPSKTGQIMKASLRVRGFLRRAIVPQQFDDRSVVLPRRLLPVMHDDFFDQSEPYDALDPLQRPATLLSVDQRLDLGILRPDTSQSRPSDVWLMPACKASRAHDWQRMFPYWASYRKEPANPSRDFQHTIGGLVMVSRGGGYYTRVGMFHLDYNDPKSPQARAFNHLEPQIIEIR